MPLPTFRAHPLRKATLLLGGFYAAVAAQAQTPTAGASTLKEIEVRSDATPETAAGPVNGYRAKRSATATKTDTPLSETPQSVTVVTRDQIVDQGALSTQEALNYAAGVRSDAYGVDSRTDSVRVRGSLPDEYLDGLRKTSGYYTANGRTDPYTLERIEVLRGPSAMLFGQGSTAGVLNMVSKRPQAERQGEVGIQAGNFGRKQIQADLTGPLDSEGRWLYRLVAVGRDANTQTQFVPDDRTLLMPSLTYRPDTRTSLTLQALYQKDRTGSTSQFLPWSGTLLPNPNGLLGPGTFVGQPSDHYNTDRKTFGWLFEHQASDALTVRQNLRLSRNDVDYVSAYADSFSLPGGWAADPVGQRRIGRYYSVQKTRLTTLTADQHVEARLNAAGVQHRVLAGLDFARFKTRQSSGTGFPDYAGGTVPSIDAYNPVYTPTALPALVASPDNDLRQTGLYLQDQMTWGAWTVVAGLRHDRVVNKTAGSDDQHDSATSKRLGLMYALGNGWSPYVSYSESFAPQTNQRSQTFKPLRGEQWEAGVKFEPAGRAVAFNAAVYELKEKNRIVNPQPLVFNQRGQTTNRGVELEARGSVTQQLDLLAHYNYTDVDRQLEGLPRHQAAVWAKYRFAVAGLTGFSAGAGVRWMGAFTDTSSGTGPQVPSVGLVDALLAYDTPQWRLALNINNLADKRYFSTCLSRGDCWFGARRTVVASATYRF